MIQSAVPETPRPPLLRGKKPLHDLTVTARLPSGTGQTTVSRKQGEPTGPLSIPASLRTSLREQPDSSVAEIGETCAQGRHSCGSAPEMSSRQDLRTRMQSCPAPACAATVVSLQPAANNSKTNNSRTITAGFTKRLSGMNPAPSIPRQMSRPLSAHTAPSDHPDDRQNQ